MGEDRFYKEVESIDELYKIVEQCLEEYNQTHKTQMNLVIFRYLTRGCAAVPIQTYSQNVFYLVRTVH